jgi:hypothetical protein
MGQRSRMSLTGWLEFSQSTGKRFRLALVRESLAW